MNVSRLKGAQLVLTLIVCTTTPASTQFLNFPWDTHGQQPDPSSTQPPSFPNPQPKTPPTRVYPGMPEFPPMDEFMKLRKSLDTDNELSFSLSGEAVFYNETMMYNMRTVKIPYVNVMVSNVEDVQKVVQFAKRYNIFLAIRSSGHSYIGRSTHDGAIVLNFMQMKGKHFNLNSDRSPAGEVTVESGNSWMEVYESVDKQVTYDDVGNPQRRVIVGGSAHTVAMGGYTQGGGHSPICRQLGLAVDNLLEATVVLADGRKAEVNEQGTTYTSVDGSLVSHTNDTSLFWALRGGGGSTWGVVTHFTFKLNFAPARFRNVALDWALTYQGNDIGSGTLKFIVKELAKLSKQWGGYFIVTGQQLDANARGMASLFLNHFGSDEDPSNGEVDALLAHNTFHHQFSRRDINYSTFLEYENTAVDAASTNSYIFNKFIQPSIANDTHKLDGLVKFLMSLTKTPTPDSGYGCTGALIGGKMAEVADGQTPVHPKFRSGLMSMSCGLSWPAFDGRDSFFENYARQKRDELDSLGEGSYFNECAEDLQDWKQEFWGMSNYNRLLNIKRTVDPDHYFWCHNCVGSDDVTSA